jgi:hypothetical protein
MLCKAFNDSIRYLFEFDLLFVEPAQEMPNAPNIDSHCCIFGVLQRTKVFLEIAQQWLEGAWVCACSCRAASALGHHVSPLTMPTLRIPANVTADSGDRDRLHRAGCCALKL